MFSVPVYQSCLLFLLLMIIVLPCDLFLLVSHVFIGSLSCYLPCILYNFKPNLFCFKVVFISNLLSNMYFSTSALLNKVLRWSSVLDSVCWNQDWDFLFLICFRQKWTFDSRFTDAMWPLCFLHTILYPTFIFQLFAGSRVIANLWFEWTFEECWSNHFWTIDCHYMGAALWCLFKNKFNI